MRYGVELPCGGDDLSMDELIETAAIAERSGWDGVFFEDYLVYYRGEDPPTYDPWILLAAIAIRTTSIHLGTTVTGLLARDPVKLAREAISLDHLSHGRVILGVGLGDPADRGAQLSPRGNSELSRGQQMDQRLDLLLELLSGAPVGEQQVRFRPRSVRSPLPVWVGGSSQAGAVARRAGRVQGVVPYKLTDTDEWSDFTADEVRALARNIAEHRSVEAEPFDIAIGGRTRDPDEAAEREAVRAAESGGATWWLEFIHPASAESMHRAVARGPVRAS